MWLRRGLRLRYIRARVTTPLPSSVGICRRPQWPAYSRCSPLYPRYARSQYTQPHYYCASAFGSVATTGFVYATYVHASPRCQPQSGYVAARNGHRTHGGRCIQDTRGANRHSHTTNRGSHTTTASTEIAIRISHGGLALSLGSVATTGFYYAT